jgi:hypothetical protein
MRRVQSPLEVLRRLNTEGRTVVAADRCIERTSSGTRGNGEIEFRAPNQSPAYLLEVEIPKTLGGSGSASVSISLKDKECAPLACDSIDTYTAQKTRNGWTVTYEGRMFE